MSSGSPRARWKWYWLAATGVVLTGLVLLLLAVGLASLEPASYAPLDSEDPEVHERARVFEENLASELTRVRQEEAPWGVRIREQDINAWLWVRFPAWVAHLRGSEAFGSEPMVQAQIESRRMILVSESLAVAFEPRVEDGRIRIDAASGSSLGRLPVPGFMFERLLGGIELEPLREAITDSERASPTTEQTSLHVQNRFQLGDGRMVELLEIELDEGAVVLVFRTVRAQR